MNKSKAELKDSVVLYVKKCKEDGDDGLKELHNILSKMGISLPQPETNSVASFSGCQYKFMRGGSKGKKCAKKIPEGNRFFCKACRKKKQSHKQEELLMKSGNTQSTASSTGPTYSTFPIKTVVTAPMRKTNINVSPIIIDEKEYYYDGKQRLVIMNIAKKIVCVGSLSADKSSIEKRLDDEQVTYCKSKNIPMSSDIIRPANLLDSVPNPSGLTDI